MVGGLVSLGLCLVAAAEGRAQDLDQQLAAVRARAAIQRAQSMIDLSSRIINMHRNPGFTVPVFAPPAYRAPLPIPQPAGGWRTNGTSFWPVYPPLPAPPRPRYIRLG
jgi:hypothetical protein